MAITLGTATQKLYLGSAAVKAAYLGPSRVYPPTSATVNTETLPAPVVVAGNTSVTVSWTRTWDNPANSRNLLIAKSTNGGLNWDSPLVLPDRPTFTSTVYSNLTNNNPYVFRLGLSGPPGDNVTVTWGPRSSLVTPTAGTITLPNAPSNLKATTNSDGYIDVTWSGEAGYNYLLEYTTSASNTVKWLPLAAITAPATSYRWEQGIDGQRYWFRASSATVAGLSPFTMNWSGNYEASAVFGKKTAPLDPPGVPVAYAFTDPRGAVRVTSTPPARDGNDFIGSTAIPGQIYLWYELQISSDDGSTWTSVDNVTTTKYPMIDGIGHSIYGLPLATTYVFRARAVNTVGPGPYSGRSVPVFVP